MRVLKNIIDEGCRMNYLTYALALKQSEYTINQLKKNCSFVFFNMISSAILIASIFLIFNFISLPPITFIVLGVIIMNFLYMLQAWFLERRSLKIEEEMLLFLRKSDSNK